MNLIAITSHTTESELHYKTTFNKLKEKLKERGLLDSNDRRRGMIGYCIEDTYTQKFGYAHYISKGKLIKELEDINELEIAMLVDGGYSHFGGYSIKDGSNFTVKICVD